MTKLSWYIIYTSCVTHQWLLLTQSLNSFSPWAGTNLFCIYYRFEIKYPCTNRTPKAHIKMTYSRRTRRCTPNHWGSIKFQCTQRWTWWRWLDNIAILLLYYDIMYHGLAKSIILLLLHPWRGALNASMVSTTGFVHSQVWPWRFALFVVTGWRGPEVWVRVRPRKSNGGATLKEATWRIKCQLNYKWFMYLESYLYQRYCFVMKVEIGKGN